MIPLIGDKPQNTDIDFEAWDPKDYIKLNSQEAAPKKPTHSELA